ncbi:MAG: hypothetical protein KAI75_02735, partial [Desulfobulbaceae bacterium]|nr:hypothetical protein [Desulfobulbaceae bacterium]
MTLSLHFLNWDAPVVHKVRDFLRPEQFPGPADFSNLLIIVPTRQAGRRLREELVLSCDALDKAMLSPRIETPAFFSAAGQSPSRLPTPAAELALWVEVLLDTDMNELQSLFPVSPATRDFPWALS